MPQLTHQRRSIHPHAPPPAGRIVFVAIGLAITGLISHASDDPLRVGLLLPPDETEALALQQGAGLAIEHANRASSRVHQLIVRGRTGQWGDDGVEAAHMALDDAVQGLIAPPGGAPSHLTLQVSGRTAIPVVSLCGDDSVIAAGVPWAVRIVPGTTAEAVALFSGLKANCGTTAWLAFVPEQRAGREARDDIEKAARTAGHVIAHTIRVPRHVPDVSTLYDQFPAVWPHGVLLWIDPEPAGHLAKYLRTAGFNGPIAGPGRLASASFRRAAGSALEGFIVVNPDLDEPALIAMDSFERSYQVRYGHAANPTAAMAYDATFLLVRLLEDAGETPVHTRFPLTNIPPGITGPLHFNSNGNRSVPLRLQCYRHGRLQPVGSVTPPIPAPG
jgi:ABC-type branched-subunit amino acid transport system substrate-binding protein